MKSPVVLNLDKLSCLWELFFSLASSTKERVGLHPGSRVVLNDYQSCLVNSNDDLMSNFSKACANFATSSCKT